MLSNEQKELKIKDVEEARLAMIHSIKVAVLEFESYSGLKVQSIFVNDLDINNNYKTFIRLPE